MGISAELVSRLKNEIGGELRSSLHDRLLYSTDASLYQIEPLGVFIPASTKDLEKLVHFCGIHRLPLVFRGGGTSLAGQGVNRALVADYSPSCRKLFRLDKLRSSVIVEVGVPLDDLNRSPDLVEADLFFAPDPATSAQATVGGCIGNNAAGSRSIRYGRTSENINALKVALSSGDTLWLGAGRGAENPKALELARGVSKIVSTYESQIRERFPKTLRRNAGYALDMVLSQLDAGAKPEDLDLTCLICGSEGTLAGVLEADLMLQTRPKYVGLAVVAFNSVTDAISAVPACVSTQPSAVELIDDVVLKAARGNRECSQYLDVLPELNGKSASAILYVEYQETEAVLGISEKFELLRKTLGPVCMREITDRGAILKAWALRKAGEPLLHGLGEAHRKPVSGLEDSAVPIERLQEFVEEFKKILSRRGTHAAYWAHASVGVLHIRPFLNLHDEKDRQHYLEIAKEVAQLAKSCGGVFSGEHGDGRIRGPFLKEYFGEDLIRAFSEIKKLFDPFGVLNPGIIVSSAEPHSVIENLRVLPNNKELSFPDEKELFFDYGDQEGFQGATEVCNGAGVCRRSAPGVMCPSFRATLDERHSTRGRGNALRLAITGQFDAAKKVNWNDAETLKTLELCLSCKACASECPSNVDISRLKAEYLAQSFREAKHTPFAARVFGNVRLVGRLGSFLFPLSNRIAQSKLARFMARLTLGIAPQRRLPLFSPSLFSLLAARKKEAATSQKTVVLFADCFVSYNDSRIGMAAVEVLESFGYKVVVPDVGCCGRAMISTGLLGQAIKSANRVLNGLKGYIEDKNVLAVIVCEPSCLSAFKDDYQKLKLSIPVELRQALAAKSYLLDQFLELFWEEHPKYPDMIPEVSPILMHGHCHQKAGVGVETSLRLLSRMTKAKVECIDSTCCGMAGAFGFKKDLYPVSMRIGEISLFPALRKASADTTIVASGTSCRQQIRDGTGREARHPAEIILQRLSKG